ncbi:MAG: XdhC family protein [Gemmatimonadota bacterium]|nr:XdhC family protein [Gemmatimonadota bacterium]
MSVLHAAEAARLLLDTADAGGSAAVALVVGGTSPDAVPGNRLALTRDRDGAPARTHGAVGDATIHGALTELLDAALADPSADDGLRVLTLADGHTVEAYLELRRPISELVIVGAGHIARPLCRVAAALGFRVTVLDDRPDFATRERFPEAQRLVNADFDDPFRDVVVHDRTHILLVTRGHKYDYACLVRALRMDPPPAYIGMIGSRRRVRATYVQLLEDRIDRALLERIHAPVGLDIGAETPEEIAVAVAAELVLVRRGGSGAPLRDVERIAGRFFSEDTMEDA